MREQVRIGRASDLGGGALKQQVVLIAYGALVATQAEPVRTRKRLAPALLRHNGERMTAQPKPNDLVHSRKPKAQAEKCVLASSSRHGKPPVILAKQGPLASAGARALITGFPDVPPRAGVVQR